MIDSVYNFAKDVPLQLIYFAIALCFLATVIGGVFMLTIEPDESWILMSTMKAFGLELPETSAVDHPTATSGGLHLVIHGLIALVSNDILVHRFVSVLFAVVLLSLVFHIANYHLKDRTSAAAATAAFAAAPGFLLQSSMATAEIVATPVFVLATLFWIRYGSRSVYFAIAGGVLFGLACATRMTCLAMLPTILIWSFFVHRRWAAGVLYPIVAIVVAIVIFAACLSAYYYAFGAGSPNHFLGLGPATGIGQPFADVLTRTNYLLVSDGIFPIFGILALVAWYVSRLESSNDPEIMRLCGFLLIAGISAWVAWVLKTPIPHIRYLWPAVPLLWLATILLGLAALKRVKSPLTFLTVHVAIIGFCLVQGLFNVRALAVGESLTIVYEYARGTALSSPREYFAAWNDQEAIARATRDLPASGSIYAHSVPATYPITYASGRMIKPLRTAERFTDRDFLILIPSDRHMWRPSWNVIAWIQENALLRERHGDYALYTIRQGAPLPKM